MIMIPALRESDLRETHESFDKPINGNKKKTKKKRSVKRNGVRGEEEERCWSGLGLF